MKYTPKDEVKPFRKPRKSRQYKTNRKGYGFDMLGNGTGSWILVGIREDKSPIILATCPKRKEALDLARIMRTHLTQYQEIKVELMRKQ